MAALSCIANALNFIMVSVCGVWRKEEPRASLLLRKAAMLIDSGEYGYCCTAIDSVGAYGHGAYSLAHEKANSYFHEFRSDYSYGAWFGHHSNEEGRRCRVLALLLAADFAESEGF